MLPKDRGHAPFIGDLGIHFALFAGRAASFYPVIIPRSATVTAAAASMTPVVMTSGIGLPIPAMLTGNARPYAVLRGKVSMAADEKCH